MSNDSVSSLTPSRSLIYIDPLINDERKGQANPDPNLRPMSSHVAQNNTRQFIQTSAQTPSALSLSNQVHSLGAGALSPRGQYINSNPNLRQIPSVQNNARQPAQRPELAHLESIASLSSNRVQSFNPGALNPRGEQVKPNPVAVQRAASAQFRTISTSPLDSSNIAVQNPKLNTFPTFDSSEKYISEFIPNSIMTGSIYDNLKPSEDSEYKLNPISFEGKQELNEIFSKRPRFQEKYKITNVFEVDHPGLTKQYEGKLEGLRLQGKNPVKPTWENKPGQTSRINAMKILKEIQREKEADKSRPIKKEDMTVSSKEKDESVRVKKVLVFHGTKSRVARLVVGCGPRFMGKTDDGYYGKGIYTTTHPDYAAMYTEAKERVDEDGITKLQEGVMIVLEASWVNLYPVVSEDWEKDKDNKPKLMGAAIETLFDGNFVPVVPATNRPNETVFIPGQPHKFDEIVLGECSQVVPRYVLSIAPKSDKPVIEKSYICKDLQAVILQYLDKNPQNDAQYLFLNQKLNDVKNSLGQKLDQNGYNLLITLRRAIEENDTENKITLVDKMNSISIKDESIREGKLNQAPEKSEDKFKKAEEYFKKNDYKSAIDEYKKLNRKYPQSTPIFIGCAKAHFQNQNLKGAIFCFEKALKCEPNNDQAKSGYVSSLVARAMDYSAKGNYAMAIEDLNEASRHDPVNVSVLGVYASVYFALNRHDEAMDSCEKGLKINQKCASALRVRGAINVERGKYEEALQDLNQAVKLAPDSMSSLFAYYYRSTLFIRKNELTNAYFDCKKALEIKPLHFESLTNLVKIFLIKNEINLAESALNDCKKINANHPTVQKLKEELFLKKKMKKSH